MNYQDKLMKPEVQEKRGRFVVWINGVKRKFNGRNEAIEAWRKENEDSGNAEKVGGDEIEGGTFRRRTGTNTPTTKDSESEESEKPSF